MLQKQAEYLTLWSTAAGLSRVEQALITYEASTTWRNKVSFYHNDHGPFMISIYFCIFESVIQQDILLFKANIPNFDMTPIHCYR